MDSRFPVSSTLSLCFCTIHDWPACTLILKTMIYHNKTANTPEYTASLNVVRILTNKINYFLATFLMQNVKTVCEYLLKLMTLGNVVCTLHMFFLLILMEVVQNILTCQQSAENILQTIIQQELQCIVSDCSNFPQKIFAQIPHVILFSWSKN